MEKNSVDYLRGCVLSVMCDTFGSGVLPPRHTIGKALLDGRVITLTDNILQDVAASSLPLPEYVQRAVSHACDVSGKFNVSLRGDWASALQLLRNKKMRRFLKGPNVSRSYNGRHMLNTGSFRTTSPSLGSVVCSVDLLRRYTTRDVSSLSILIIRRCEMDPLLLFEIEATRTMWQCHPAFVPFDFPSMIRWYEANAGANVSALYTRFKQSQEELYQWWDELRLSLNKR